MMLCKSVLLALGVCHGIVDASHAAPGFGIQVASEAGSARDPSSVSFRALVCLSDRTGYVEEDYLASVAAATGVDAANLTVLSVSTVVGASYQFAGTTVSASEAIRAVSMWLPEGENVTATLTDECPVKAHIEVSFQSETFARAVLRHIENMWHFPNKISYYWGLSDACRSNNLSTPLVVARPTLHAVVETQLTYKWGALDWSPALQSAAHNGRADGHVSIFLMNESQAAIGGATARPEAIEKGTAFRVKLTLTTIIDFDECAYIDSVASAIGVKSTHVKVSAVTYGVIASYRFAGKVKHGHSDLIKEASSAWTLENGYIKTLTAVQVKLNTHGRSRGGQHSTTTADVATLFRVAQEADFFHKSCQGVWMGGLDPRTFADHCLRMGLSRPEFLSSPAAFVAVDTTVVSDADSETLLPAVAHLNRELADKAGPRRVTVDWVGSGQLIPTILSATSTAGAAAHALLTVLFVSSSCSFILG
eukprot:TRINITY_DN111555_c0_g1_i1.p1 TRINITY_DN111555_c0_g1~~TRINITY_DN111555_c0_g1_i1.p1  ORF type:complete len:478 (-),score=49.37 TRINITY_DN111555_c0_g1_i1:246-1679(-)